MENLYCTIFLVDVSQNPEEVETVSSRIVQLIEDHGGVIKLNNPWGKRRLAYTLEGRTSAFYFEIEFTASSHLNIPSIIEKEYRLNDRVLRYLTYVVTKEELEQRRLSERRGGRSSAGDDRRPAPRTSRDDSPAGKEKVAAAAPADAETKPKKAAEPVEAAEAEKKPETAAEPVEAAVVEEKPETVAEPVKEKPETVAEPVEEKPEEVAEAVEAEETKAEPETEATKTEKE